MPALLRSASNLACLYTPCACSCAMAMLHASAPLRLARSGAPALRVARRAAVRLPSAAARPAVGLRSRGPLAPRASGAEPPDEAPKEARTKPGELLTKKVVSRAYNQEQAKRVLEQLKTLGADDPVMLQKLFVRRGLSRLYPRAVRARLRRSPACTGGPLRRRSRLLQPPCGASLSPLSRLLPQAACRITRSAPLRRRVLLRAAPRRGGARCRRVVAPLRTRAREPWKCRVAFGSPIPRATDIRGAKLQRRLGRLPGLRAVSKGAS